MLTLLFSLLFASAVSAYSHYNLWGTGATIGYGLASFFLCLILFSFIIRRKMKPVQEGLQAVMTKGQTIINNKVQQFQSRPGGNPAQMQKQLEITQQKMLREALEYTCKMEPYKKWSPLMGRQIDTMRLQFYYQLKDFDHVDTLLKKQSLFTGPMLSEPILVCMKMARDYKNKNFKAAAKTYKKRIKWFRGERGTLLYALMSWIHMKNGDPDEARRVLLTGKEATDNKTLTRNWEHLSNRNEKKFSNAGLGDEWYALYLENPGTPKQKRMRGNSKAAARF